MKDFTENGFYKVCFVYIPLTLSSKSRLFSYTENSDTQTTLGGVLATVLRKLLT